MKKNFEKRSLTGMEIFLLVIIVYALLTFLLRLWSPEMPKFFVVQRPPMIDTTYWHNLLQLPVYIFDVFFILIIICFFGCLTVLVPLVGVLIGFVFIRTLYNLFAHILPIPYWDFGIDELENTVFFDKPALIIYAILGLIAGIVQFITIFASQC